MKLIVTKDVNVIKDFAKEFQTFITLPFQMVRNQFGYNKEILLTKMKNTQVKPKAIKDGESYKIESNNPALDLYCLEGMKLFNQGEFSKTNEKKVNELGVYLQNQITKY